MKVTSQDLALVRDALKAAEAALEAAAKASAVDLELHRAVKVTFGDSRAVGNCATGTRQWCARAGLDSLALAACRRAVALSPPADAENFATAP